MRKVLVLAAICTVAVLGGTPAQAACTSPTPVYHTGAPAIPIVGCPDGKPVSAFLFQLSAPANNNGPVDVMCEQAGPGCGTDPIDTAGNGTVLLETDWSINGFTGCPTPNPLGLSLQCNDGSGALVTVGFCVNFLGYDVELSMPFDGSFTLPLNVGPNPTTNALQNNGRPRLMSLNRTGGMDSMQVHVDPPVIQHHCLPDTLGFAAFQVPDTGCPELACDTFVPPTLVRGGLYTSTQPCSATDARPAILARASWTPVALDGSGNANVMMPTAPSGQCNYLGTSTNAGAGETPNITGFVVVGGPTAASPIAEAVRAVRKGGSVEVTFRTSSELGLLGFNIYAAGKAKGGEIKLNDTLIQATGAGGAGSQYSLSYALASLKGNRGIIVESVLTDTSTVRAPRVEF